MKRSINVRYTVSREPEHERFPWIVTDSHGNPALWRDDPKVGKVPQRFRTEAFAQAAADRLNDEAE
jgi:hypothetical protein